MSEFNLDFFDNETKNKIISIILVGGKRYDKTNYNDTDYAVIIDDDNFEYELKKDLTNKIDYLCYGKKYVERLINGESHHNKYFLMLDLFNQDDNIVYGKKVFNFSINNKEDREFIFELYKEQLNKKRVAICTNVKYSKYLYYTFSLLFYLNNNSYSLNKEQLDVVHNVHRFINIEEKYVKLLCDTFELDNEYCEGIINILCNYEWHNTPKKHKQDLRELRKPLLYAFDLWEKAVLRGREEESEEIMKWYYDLLDIDNNQNVVFNIPSRIKYYLN